MKGAEKRMKAQTTLFGKIVKRYDIPLDQINDFNSIYEINKKNLNSFGPRLAGRLDSELDFTHLLGQTKLAKTIGECINDYVDTLEKLGRFSEEKKLHILSCWVNDMKEGEYNPPHTHHDRTGFSTVLFLKVPEFINDAKDPHKFKDGQLGFIGNDATCTWMEPEVGHFYVFEAGHQHCVMPFKTKIKGDIRRSMSFNFINNVQ